MKTVVKAMIATSLIAASSPVLAQAAHPMALQGKGRCTTVMASFKGAAIAKQCPTEAMA